MNFGVNLYNWLLSNAQPLVLVAIVVIGLYLGFKREFTKLIGFSRGGHAVGWSGVQRGRREGCSAESVQSDSRCVRLAEKSAFSYGIR